MNKQQKNDRYINRLKKELEREKRKEELDKVVQQLERLGCKLIDKCKDNEQLSDNEIIDIATYEEDAIDYIKEKRG